jgi:hypothetical protein
MLRVVWVCLLGSAGLSAQTIPDARTEVRPAPPLVSGTDTPVLASGVEGPSAAVFPVSDAASVQAQLPDSPGTRRLLAAPEEDPPQTGGGQGLPPCPTPLSGAKRGGAPAADAAPLPTPCMMKRGIYRQFLNSPLPLPLTPRQKGILAARDVIDPFNLLTITANAAFTVGINPRTAYGPGMAGFGRDAGYSLAQDATGEFIGTFVVCSLAHQDPHYHRDPEGTAKQRVLHALRHTVISQHDDGRPMPNYENFITYPASALISNLYVPGVNGNGPSTVARILTGLATDPVNNLITEFLPDFARRVHVRVVFVQQILNQIATGQQL